MIIKNPNYMAEKAAKKSDLELFYEDTYRREDDGQWRIARTGYVRSYEAMQPLPEGWQLTANRWAEPAEREG